MKTICVKCKHHSWKCCWLATIKSHNCHAIRGTGKLNVVTGRIEYQPPGVCSIWNKGKCQYFEPKVSLWRRFIAWMT